MNKVLLKIAMLPSGLWRSMGADIEQLKAILHTKLIMDNRKPLSFGNNRGMQHQKKERKHTVLLTMFLSLMMGMIYLFPILMTITNPVLGLAMFYTLFAFFFTFSLITDFVNVLIDTKDKFVLFARPVNDKTIFLSRIIYIGIYLFRLVIPMSIPAWVAFGIIKGWKGVLFFPIPLVLMVFIVLLIVCALYALMLKLAPVGRFKEVLNSFQIVFSILFFASYMMSSRMMRFDVAETLTLQAFDWARYVPTYWIATMWAWIEPTASIIAGTKWLSILAIIFPFVSLWLTVKVLAPSFIKKLVLSESNGEEIIPDTKKQKGEKARPRFYTWANMLNESDAGKAGFIMTWLQTARSRNFKMKVFPAFAYVPVYFFYILLGSGKGFEEVWNELPETNSYFFMLYLCTFVIMQALSYIAMSEQYKAAWIYYSTPVDKPGEILTGAFKAMWLKYFLPFMLFIAAFIMSVWGPKTILDIVLATINVTLFTVAIMFVSYRILPFSQKEQIKDGGIKNIVRVLLTMVLIGALGGGHYLASSMLWLKLIFLVLACILLWMFYDSLRNTTWARMKAIDE